ncbi:hypothetical protein [Flavobacterium sp. CAU 1735]|uniref:hypothetical protein n=1 Tax=Flavobacterium sp. CAU 1735 TaxID=3140361 RepID=UPI00325FFD16
MTKSLPYFMIFLVMMTYYGSQAQTTTGTEREKEITTSYSNYFKSDREKIHLHLNKTVYLNEESIWFKGYFIEEKSKIPSTKTTNIYIDLLDEQGLKIQSELYYLSYGTFEGYIRPDKKIKSGKYYIRVYTNFMNNFQEDESTVYPITILNPVDATTVNTNTVANLKALTVQFFPEGGVFLENNSNTIAIKITDCNGNPIAVKNGSVINAKGIVVTSFSTNEKGIGRFDLLQNYNAPYKAVFTIGNNTQTFALPTFKTSNFTFSINNYTSSDRAFLTLKTSSPSNSDIPLSLIIQQDEKVSLIEKLTLKKGTTEDTFTIDNQHFYNGINTLVLIDANNKKLAERLIFKPYDLVKKATISLSETRNDTLYFKGKSTIPFGSLSISVLPEKTAAIGNARSLYDNFVFSTYLDNPMIANTSYYLSDFSKGKHYELDTYLITQKPKYDFETISKSPIPTETYKSEVGVTIKGTINKKITNKGDYYVQMGSFYNSVRKKSDINDKNEFIFNNAILYDSASVSLTLYNKNGMTENLPMSIQVLDGQSPFLKPLPKPDFQCHIDAVTETKTLAIPQIQNKKAIQLDNVTIKKKAKTPPPLKNIGRYNNSMARGYKISSGDFASYREILSFIGANGFDVIYQNGSVYINNRITRSLRGNPSPAIFVDDVPLQPDLTMLIGMSLDMVDEIYISKSGYGMGMEGGSGFIRIYTKRYMGTDKAASKAQSYVVKRAAQDPKDFKNPYYQDYDEGFINYGTINWIPDVRTDQNGDFLFSIPNYNQKSIKVKIEGIGSDGELISEEKTIQL